MKNGMNGDRKLDRELLLRLLGGELPPAEAHALEERLRDDAALAEQWSRLRRLGHELRDQRASSFEPGFADRVMARMPSNVIVLDSTLRRQFRALLPTAAAALLVLLGHNVFVADRPADQSIIEAALGLEPVTVDAIYSLESTVYAGGTGP